jgi:aryl-alcohol dehydrogenase-like predicted oxidoreductase
MSDYSLGCGLLALGRPWGKPIEKQPPAFEASQEFLNVAFANGIKTFDTANAYLESQSRLGVWLMANNSRLASNGNIVVASKIGLDWSPAIGDVPISLPLDIAKQASVSMETLGRLDLLQFHQKDASQITALLHIGLYSHLRSSLDCPSLRIGGSVKTQADFDKLLKIDEVTQIQIPAGLLSELPRVSLDNLAYAEKELWINRPFGEGAKLQQMGAAACFDEILSRLHKAKVAKATILTGTSNPDHLLSNIEAFNTSLAKLD